MRRLRLVGAVLGAIVLALAITVVLALRTSAPLAILIRNTPQLGGVGELLPPPSVYEQSVLPTAGDPSLTGVLYDSANGPGVLLVNGVEVPGGWRNVDIVTFATSIAAAGETVYVPDLPGGLEQGIVTVDTLRALEADVAWFRQRLGGRRLSLVGVCVGASLALLSAEHQPSDVDAVIGLDPYASLQELLQAATTGRGPDASGQEAPFQMAAWVQADLAQSLGATVSDPVLRGTASHARAQADDATSGGLADFQAPPVDQLTPDAAAIWRLLGSENTPDFDATYPTLPVAVKSQIADLSPLANTSSLKARVLIAAPYNDFAFPAGEATRLQQARPDLVQVTRSSALDHVSPAFGPGVLAGYWRLWRFAAASVQLMSKP
ncbi:MAG: alpha/beta fold hydrolase [Chloroflexi bacterium]|nr:alpha/beta fold hydrolase [Chloroflexota bacterium]